MEHLLPAFELLLQPAVIVALLIGSVGGVVIGAIPGVGPAVAIAILLPTTFIFEPLVGLSLLLGIYGSSMYGGALPAILMNTPGTAVNALTTYDGYPLTRKGQAQRALGLAYSASFFGAVVSIISLVVLMPVLAKVAPMFGSREIFLAALFGIILMILTHRGQVFAAGMMTCFGILLNTVGMEPINYTQRFTFGQSWLSSGVNLVVVVLGLFALSQAFLLLSGSDKHVEPQKISGSVFSAMREFWQHKRVAAVSSGAGVGIGIIPGVGEFVSQFVAYSYASRTSKTPEQFGKGAPEGLIASEAANNSVPAAALIPLLALGVPGESLTAMMLAVFYVHNVVPGPQLLTGQMDFVIALYLALLFLNIVALLFLLGSTKTLIRVINIPNRIVGTMVLLFSFVGVYSLRNSLTDCLIATGFGLFGAILKRLNIPIVPIILGMVLGGIMEAKFRSAMTRIQSPFDLFDRPISAVLIIAIVGLLLMALRTAAQHYRRHCT
ncbi:tripartite tricarboxylate transporter permease [Sulfitobacter sp. S0837]|uniref:tripartite tricarboxylate transporter permease n=1 Tax=Sulfitobacter maritimus TaxID=2741719 RepID=UPI0015841C63|nr:tripartite tricarboxylate transporter permease [Sulfitobacter maritimus]NUH63902.1 tripartite tricarboxylate transporter permease [Sulfitobacter maritimus]